MVQRKGRGLLLAAVCVTAAVVASTGAAGRSDDLRLTDVPTANTKSPGVAPASLLSRGLQQEVVAQGANKVENPSAAVSTYGYDNDVVTPSGDPQMLPTPTSATEAHKTEPDKNTYLVFRRGLPGATAGYDYGTHFLFQGHEGGAPGYITRINLDADSVHRVTLLATADTSGAALPDFDGSTWEPWAQRLLFTAEIGFPGGGVWASNLSVPAQGEDLRGVMGSSGYEGIQDDSAGELWIVEDAGGANKGTTTARRPNSFVYRFVPKRPGDLHNGKLQVLQVLNAAGMPI